MRSVLHTIWHTGNGSKMTAGPFTESRKESTFIAPVGFYVTRRDNGAHGGCCTLLRGRGGAQHVALHSRHIGPSIIMSPPPVPSTQVLQ
jgi:hypothetical protein